MVTEIDNSTLSAIYTAILILSLVYHHEIQSYILSLLQSHRNRIRRQLSSKSTTITVDNRTSKNNNHSSSTISSNERRLAVRFSEGPDLSQTSYEDDSTDHGCTDNVRDRKNNTSVHKESPVAVSPPEKATATTTTTDIKKEIFHQTPYSPRKDKLEEEKDAVPLVTPPTKSPRSVCKEDANELKSRIAALDGVLASPRQFLRNKDLSSPSNCSSRSAPAVFSHAKDVSYSKDMFVDLDGIASPKGKKDKLRKHTSTAAALKVSMQVRRKLERHRSGDGLSLSPCGPTTGSDVRRGHRRVASADCSGRSASRRTTPQVDFNFSDAFLPPIHDADDDAAAAAAVLDESLHIEDLLEVPKEHHPLTGRRRPSMNPNNGASLSALNGHNSLTSFPKAPRRPSINPLGASLSQLSPRHRSNAHNRMSKFDRGILERLQAENLD